MMHSENNVTLTGSSTATESLIRAKELVNQLELGNIEQADSIISEICKTRENDLFQDVGKLTRELHQTISEFGGDSPLNSLTNKEVTDARHDLKYVVGLTEQSANQTLGAIEESVPLLNSLSEHAINLQKLLNGQINEPTKSVGFESIAAEIDSYFAMVIVETKNIHQHMNTVLVAQGYQDITGQIIQRVSTMLQDVEQSLLAILQVNSQHINEDELNKSAKNNTGYGPSVPDTDNADVMQNQDDVDELLSTLGF